MPIREFSGELDKPKVREFSGELDAPSGNPLQPFNFDPNTPSVSAVDPASINPADTSAQVHQDYLGAESQNPWIERGSTQKHALSALSAFIGSRVPGAGLLLSSVGAGIGGTLGELGQQKLQNEPVDLKEAGKEGAAQGLGNLAFGFALKEGAALARRLFHSELDDAAKAAAAFAREKGVPFPLSSAAPGSKAATAQQASRALLPGEIKTQLDANKVAQFLNREVSTIQAQGRPLDEAAVKGQQFLRKVFEPGETVYTETFKGLREVVGDSTAIPLPNTSQAIQGVAEALKTRGATGALAQQLQTLAKRPASQMTAQQIDDLYGELLKKAGKNPNAIAEMNVVLSAIVKDVDAVGKQFGVNFADDVASAKVVRDQFRELRKIPGLERLAKDFGDKGGAMGSRQWMSELFSNPNGKALAELRARNPELYHELADSWLASNIQRFSRPSDAAIGNVLDGKALRAWYEQNAQQLKLIYGAPQAQALDNFTRYASHMSGAVSRAAGGRTFEPANLLARGAAETAGILTKPLLLLPSEAGSYVLAKGLSDPNSALFRLFTEGVKPSTLKFLETSAQLSGQAAGRKVAESGED
jgi:hypothetical protein